MTKEDPTKLGQEVVDKSLPEVIAPEQDTKPQEVQKNENNPDIEM